MTDDPVTVAELIQNKISELENERPKLFDSAQAKAQAISDYDRTMAIVILKLRNKTITKFEGEEIGALQANLIPIVAKGFCWKECFTREAEEGGYKAIISNIESIKAELNGLQSINRHLDSLKS